MSEWVIATALQVLVIIFAAGRLSMKVDDIGARVKRIESWINGTRNEDGNRL